MNTPPLSFKTATANPSFEGVVDIDPTEVSEHAKTVHLIDVRQPDEYTGELGHIAGAKLLVLNTIPDRLSEIPSDETVVFICRSGQRSAQASAFAAMNGYKHVFNMKGGMLRWNQLGFPIEKLSEN